MNELPYHDKASFGEQVSAGCYFFFIAAMVITAMTLMFLNDKLRGGRPLLG